MVTTSKGLITQVYGTDGGWGEPALVMVQAGRDIAISNDDIDAFIECVTEVRDEIRNGVPARRGQRANRGTMTNVQARTEPLMENEVMAARPEAYGIYRAMPDAPARHDAINEAAHIQEDEFVSREGGAITNA